MARVGTTLVHDGPHLQALVKRGTSPYVLVTFNARGFNADGRSIWAERLVDTLGLNAVGFVTRRPNWFPGEDFTAAMAAARPFLEPFAERIGYGYSQGGYAAIRASRPLGLTTTIAMSPQWSIDPADIVDARYNGFFNAASNQQMALTAADAPARLFIFADTAFVKDRTHLAEIAAAMPGARIVPVPSTDHGSIRVVQGSGPFAAMLTAVREGDAVLPVIARLRRDSAVRRAVLIQRALGKQQVARAYSLYKARPFEPNAQATALLHFARAGEALRVLRDARALATSRLRDPYAKAVLAYVLASAGQTERAQALAERAAAMSKHNKVLRLTRAVRSAALRIDLDEEDD